MTRTRTFVLTALIATLGFGGVAVAKGGPEGHGGHGGGHHGSPIAQVIRELDLTDAQKEEAMAIREAAQADKGAAHEAREAFMDGMMEELASGAPDRARIAQLEDAAHEAMATAASARTDALLDFYATLTPEQQQQFVAELEEMKARHEERRGEGRERRGPPEGEGDW